MSAAKYKAGRPNESTTYEVRHLQKAGGWSVEPFDGLDRARLAGLGYALDGCWGHSVTSSAALTGIVEIHRIIHAGESFVSSTLIDVLDERVAFRLLNEVELPRAGQLSLIGDQFQGDVHRLARLGV